MTTQDIKETIDTFLDDKKVILDNETGDVYVNKKDVEILIDLIRKEEQERINYELARKISMAYPLSFAKDMGTHAVLHRGVRESTHIRMTTDQEIKVIENIESIINSSLTEKQNV